MILYDFACQNGHHFEAGLATMASANPPCPRCGAETSRRPSRLNIGGRASAGPSREQMPRSWNAVRQGDRETIAHWHRVAERREALEERYPELAGDRRPILAHEGIFSGRPLRAGDDIATAVTSAIAEGATPHSHHPAPTRGDINMKATP
ncbi:zinc ribbon domain-containing protein [Paenarthrobacter sp. 2TAF44]|uniref:zinc ribbon domain-containing protein n=1 Tax=Paenarthrobacter sp. 2TAF44 TaxID=3233018 RepID=UPI003F984F95